MGNEPNKEELLVTLTCMINKDKGFDQVEKDELLSDAKNLNKAELQDAIDEFEKDNETSSSNDLKAKKVKLHKTIEGMNLGKELKKVFHDKVKKMAGKQIDKIEKQQEGLEEYLTKLQDKPKKVAEKKTEKKSLKVKDNEVVIDGGYPGGVFNPKGEHLKVIIKQREACRIHKEKGSKGSITVIHNKVELEIPKNGGHVLFLDGALSIDGI